MFIDFHSHSDRRLRSLTSRAPADQKKDPRLVFRVLVQLGSLRVELCSPVVVFVTASDRKCSNPAPMALPRFSVVCFWRVASPPEWIIGISLMFHRSLPSSLYSSLCKIFKVPKTGDCDL